MSSAISIAVDESRDIKDTAHVALFVKFNSRQGPKEELLLVDGQTRGEDIANIVQKCLEDNGINVNTIISTVTDEAKSMSGINKGFISILKSKFNHEILSFHYIIHQQALCAQSFPKEIVDVMNLVITITNSILAKAPSHRQFKELLDGNG